MPRTIMLVGAPALFKCSETELTVNNLLPAFKKIVDQDCVEHSSTASDDDGNERDSTTAPSPVAVWRLIPLTGQHLHTGWSQPDWICASPHLHEVKKTSEADGPAKISFLTYSGTSTDKEGASQNEDLVTSSELSQHLEQSFALHEEAPSSQVTPAAKTPLLSKTRLQPDLQGADADGESDTPAIPAADHAKSKPSMPTTDPKTPLNATQRVSLPYLTDISDLPSAQSLVSLEPQTVTVDMLVGVISIGSTRTVKIRRTGRETSLIEVLVGDETRAGFTVTFWLSEDTNAVAQKAVPCADIKTVVQSLRAGDIIGLRNIALGHFRGRVHGQTLGRRGKAGGETQVHRICQAGRKLPGRIGGQLLNRKLQRVSAWARNFVRPAGVEGPALAKKRKRDVEDVELPPDETQ